jgi:outer membrane protein OmpA-like peptidoglycan-associated protein
LFSSVSTLFVSSGSGLVPVQNLVARNESAVANSFGIPKLTPEKSMQYSVGITSKPIKGKNITITADAYLIDIKDRIVLSGTFTKSNPLVASLLSAFPDINSVAFFTNAIKTSTMGLDVVASNGGQKVGKGILDVTLALNFNKTEVKEIKTTPVLAASPTLTDGTLFNRQEKGRIEEAQPRNKQVLSIIYRIGKATLASRVSRFGSVRTYDPINPALDESFSPKVVTDMSLSYRPIYWMNVTVGANNIGDVYPDRLQNFANTSDNRFQYSRNATQFGFNGGYWFTNLAFDLTNIKSTPKPKPVPVAPIVVAPKPEPPKDTDGDGVPDKDDKCPTLAGIKSLGGCPDKDGDGVTDAEDKCPDVAGIKIFGGCPDTDGDGIEDAKDKCPTKPGTAKYEGCPVPDTDGDGLNDDYDKCPTVPGPIANDGCPEKKKEETQNKIDKSAKEILFETGSAILKKSSNAALDAITKELADDANLSLDIEGHTDNTGSEKANQALSQARANAVKSYIEKKGIAAARLNAIGYGSSQPVADNKTAAGRAQNRRVVLKLK